MNSVFSIKDSNGTFSVEIGGKDYYFPSLSLTVNKVEYVSFMGMVDIVVEHTNRLFELNKHKLNKFCINTGFARNCYINVTFNNTDGDVDYGTKDDSGNYSRYWLAIYYAIFMIAYFADDSIAITEEEANTFGEVKNKINTGELIT